MRWYLDTHKFMSEITRKALQIITARGITSESDTGDIENAERELANAGVYQSFDSAKGRIRRALFTYFKAYACIDDNEHLTEIGRLFANNEITVREMCFHYILNYRFNGDGVSYYPVQLLLRSLKELSEKDNGQAFISAYDFSRIAECNSVEDIDDAFINELVDARRREPISVNERSVGFDVWSNILISAGILCKTTDRTLVVKDEVLSRWILDTYDKPLSYNKGSVLTGPFEYLPLLPVKNPKGDVEPHRNNGKALQAFLFEGIEKEIIDKYIFQPHENSTFSEMQDSLGTGEACRSFYKHFNGLEKLVGYCLAGNSNQHIRTVGSILASVELSEAEITQIMPAEITVDYDMSERLSEGTNILLYGVPGSGKSWTIEHEYCKPDSTVERLVFHPDYTNGDFVGQILPVVDEDKQVTYEFTPGPFTAILRDAYRNPLRSFVLIIEEINRGNAPAIFGEIFQLLDRCVEPKTEGNVTYPAGTSEYGITHASVAEYVYDDSKHKVRIPSNLSIVATMNTSDQNVFTLDTAFQRRWKMRLIDNYFDNVRDSLAEAKILDTDVTWKKFCESINSIIVGNKSRMVSAEDKRMGVYFIHEKDVAFDFTVTPSEGYPTILVEYNSLLKTERANQLGDSDRLRLFAIRNALMQNRIFPEKVIKYLWDDAFKFNPEALFDTERFDNLEDIIKEFVFSTGNDRLKVFKREVRTELLQDSQE